MRSVLVIPVDATVWAVWSYHTASAQSGTCHWSITDLQKSVLQVHVWHKPMNWQMIYRRPFVLGLFSLCTCSRAERKGLYLAICCGFISMTLPSTQALPEALGTNREVPDSTAVSVAMVTTDIFQINWFSVRNKIGEIAKLFVKIENPENRGVI